MSRIFPQGVDASTFNKALDELGAIVGKEWVFIDELPLSSYRDAYSPLADGEMLPSAAVAPTGVEQIQKILKVANAYQLPIWTIGTGRNFAYGGPAPRKTGYVMLDLRRMNKVIEVNEKLLDHPEIVNQDPFEEGWLLRVAMTNPSEVDSLMTSNEYDAFIGGLS